MIVARRVVRIFVRGKILWGENLFMVYNIPFIAVGGVITYYTKPATAKGQGEVISE